MPSTDSNSSQPSGTVALILYPANLEQANRKCMGTYQGGEFC